MLSSRALRALALSAGACLALGAGLAGCTAATRSTVSVTGTTLTIYVSVPTELAGNQQAQDVADAEQLAFEQKQSEVTRFKVKLVRLSSSKPSANARAAIEDTSAIAYLGEILPGSSTDSAGITNAQGILQVSPTDTALELTEATGAVPGAPNRYYEALKTYGRTFARMVPNTRLEARAQVQEMQAMSVKKLYVADDGSQYGKAASLAVRQAALPSISVTGSPAGADAEFYGTGSSGALSKAATSSPAVKLFGPSALAFAPGLSPALRNVYLTAPGFLPSNLPKGAKQQFLDPFRARLHHPPSSSAIFGYEAMAAVLDVLRDAGPSANDRAKVVHDFFALKSRPSVLGTYSINGNGDTSLAPFVLGRLKAGKLVPFRFSPATG